MRHGKSSWKDRSLKDFDRPLNKRGLRQGEYMKNFLPARIPRPDLVLCSGSVRTRQTWDSIRGAWNPPPPVEIREDLYLPGLREMRDIIRNAGRDTETLLIISHNPVSTILVSHLDSLESAEHLGTLGTALLTLNINAWEELQENCGTLDGIYTPVT